MRAVFVGDHPTFDTAGAKSSGLKTVWKPNSVGPPPSDPDAIINALFELEATLSRTDKNLEMG